MGANMTADVDVFRAGLDGHTRETVDAIRAIILSSNDALTEGMKWNAPSFAHGGDDRITLGLERKGGVPVVVHRGAKPRSLDGFSFTDFAGLARWPSPDRGITVYDKADLERRADDLRDLCSRWIAATT